MDDAISDMVKARRQALHGRDDGHRPWGLALSGGGMRSAAFSLGLLKALAMRRQLLKFDLVSTVSGGGYVGATLGRLCTNAKTSDEVRDIERALGDVDRARFGAWLRGNGRYLIPGGMRDTLFAAALYLRNLVGTHVEIAIAASLIGMLLAAVNLLMWDAAFQTIDLNSVPSGAAIDMTDMSSVHSSRDMLRWATQWPTLWFMLIGPFIASGVMVCAYWSVRDERSVSSLSLQMGMWSIFAFGAVWISPALMRHYSGPGWAGPAFVMFALSWICALAWVLWRSRTRNAAEMRNELTDALASVIHAALLIAMLGLLDRSGWWLANESQGGRVSYGAALLVAAVILRAGLPILLSQKRQASSAFKTFTLTLASLLGLILSFCLAAWWIGAVYAVVLLPIFAVEGLDFSQGWVWLSSMLIVVGSYAVVTGRNLSSLNISSLHMFYKARIVRGYLGAANARRLGASPSGELSGLEPPQIPVGEVDEHDDISQLHYAPHLHGGPVHLANVCINQTHDPKQTLFIRDRKSVPLTIGPLGWMQAGRAPWARAKGNAALTLGAWTAISGATRSPQATRLDGLMSSLKVFAGLRLGYWWNSAEAGIVLRGATLYASSILMKTRFMLLEYFGLFPGSESAHWYLSDGGHFENTGAYSLLQQECQLIVIADCGVDPHFRFSDIDALVRLARSDFQAEITFMKPRADMLPQGRTGLGAFGSLNEVGADEGYSCLVLADIQYRSGGKGVLVVVKPNVFDGMPADLINYKIENPSFPQDTDTDRRFSEAQWESYFRLGSRIGANLTADLLNTLMIDATEHFEFDDISLRETQTLASKGDEKQGGLRRRLSETSAVTATIGVGTIVTVALAVWQNYDAKLKEASRSADQLLMQEKELAVLWSKLTTSKTPESVAALAAMTLLVGDANCRNGGINFMATYRLSVRIVDDVRQACDAGPDYRQSAACTRLLDSANGIDCLQPANAPPCVPRYWGRDYTGQTGARYNCSGILPRPWGLVTALRELNPEPAVTAVPVTSENATFNGNAGPARPADVCDDTVVYILMYGRALRDEARRLRGPWLSLGASVPPIEDVLITSRRAGRSPPLGHSEPSVVINNESQRACAQALVSAAPSPTGQPWTIKLNRATWSHPIEVWLPR